MPSSIVKIGDHYDSQSRVTFIFDVASTIADLPTDVAPGSLAYSETIGVKYLFGPSGTWNDVTAALAGCAPEILE